MREFKPSAGEVSSRSTGVHPRVDVSGYARNTFSFESMYLLLFDRKMCDKRYMPFEVIEVYHMLLIQDDITVQTSESSISSKSS